MKKRFIVITMCLVLTAGLAVPIASAQHNYGRSNTGRNVAVGVAVGAIVGGLIGAAASRNRNRYPYYGNQYPQTNYGNYPNSGYGNYGYNPPYVYRQPNYGYSNYGYNQRYVYRQPNYGYPNYGYNQGNRGYYGRRH